MKSSRKNIPRFSASSSEQKYEDGAELYQKAGNAFKIGGFHNDAGDAYKNAAKLYTDNLKNTMEASKCLKEAGEKMSSP